MIWFGTSWVIFRGFGKFSSELLDSIQLKFLILIEFPNIFHWKPVKKSKSVWSWGRIWAKLGPML